MRDKIEQLLEYAKLNDTFNMTSYDFREFEIAVLGAIDKYTMTDFELHKQMLYSANIKFVEVKGNFEKELDDHLYIATYASFDDGIIMVYEFSAEGNLWDTYVADACRTLEEFAS